jgi:DNA-binding CsgD family transcriptional regulator
MNSNKVEPFGSGPAPSAETLALVSDALAWPLLLLRGDGSLIHANLAARRLLAERRLLVLMPKGRVQPADGAQRSEFQAALAAALQAAGDAPPPLLQWASAGDRFSVSLTALRGPAEEHAVLLLALSPETGRLADLHAYAAIHGLSDAETRVLLHLARGDSSAKAAAALGVSAATVRSQTVSLRRKTGHPSVAELMRSLAALPPLALVGDVGEK